MSQDFTPQIQATVAFWIKHLIQQGYVAPLTAEQRTTFTKALTQQITTFVDTWVRPSWKEGDLGWLWRVEFDYSPCNLLQPALEAAQIDHWPQWIVNKTRCIAWSDKVEATEGRGGARKTIWTRADGINPAWEIK